MLKEVVIVLKWARSITATLSTAVIQSVVESCGESLGTSSTERVSAVNILNTSRGTPHPFTDAGAVADSLIDIHNVTMKFLFAVNRSCIHKGF
jgi:hypothetical protein